MRVLFLTHRLPYTPNRGDRVRAFHIIRALVPHAEVIVASLVHGVEESAHENEVYALGAAEVLTFRVPRGTNYLKAAVQLAGSRPLTHLLLDAPAITESLRRLILAHAPDVVLAYCSSMARFALEPPLAGIPLVVDLVDVDSAKWSALAQVSTGPRRWIYQREARVLSRFERKTAEHARHVVVVNDREAQALKQIAPQATIHVIPNGVDLAHLAPASSPGGSEDVVFCGVMDYSPNVEAVLWFARDVWPRVRRRRPKARFMIVGSNPVSDVRRLAQDGSAIVVTGTVPDVRHYLWNAAVSVAPLKTARGVQNKVLEAIAAGLPAVITPQVLEGLPSEVHRACRVGVSPEEFATETLSLLDLTSDARRALAQQADLAGLTWESQLAPLRDLLASAAGGSR